MQTFRVPFRSVPASRALALPLALGLLATAARADHSAGGIVGGAAGPINAVPAGTLPEGKWSIGLRLDMIDLNHKSNAELQSLPEEIDSTDRVEVPSLSIAYGATNDLTLGALVPYVIQRNLRESTGGGIEDNGDVKGWGATSVYAQWRLLNQRDEDGTAALEFAVLGGLKTPTGDTREHTPEGELLEGDHQPSQGSWEPFVGVTATRSFERASLTADLIYTHPAQGVQKTTMGNSLKYDLAWGYRLSDELKHEHVHEDGSLHMHGTAEQQWDVVLELNGIWRDKIDFDGAHDDNSGGNRVDLSPGVRLSTIQHVSYYASFGVPIIQDVNGEEHTTDSHLVVGMSWMF